jgi:outer membrane receptor protein involved in Fe transport
MDWTAFALVFLLQHGRPHPRISESVTVSSSATLPRLLTPAAVTVLERAALESAPALTLDETLRSVPGFSLFRRSSSRVANPTTQGVTLRGMAASGSSRALVMADDIPLNDPVGGWVYWNRVPAAALTRVEVIRGPSGDLYGPDAVGGLVRIQSDSGSGTRGLVEAGTDATARVSAFGGTSSRHLNVFGAAEWFQTDGFVIVAPESRGSIDTPASSEHVSVHGGVLTGRSVQVTARGSYFEEDRGNGTPFQRNGTNVRQVSSSIARANGGNSGWSGRVYGVSQDYEQTFSAVLTGRTAERGTNQQHVDAAAVGGAFEWGWSTSAVALGMGASTRYVSADLQEQSLPAVDDPGLTEASQVTAGAAAYATLTPWRRISVSGNLRIERWDSNLRSGESGGEAHVFVSPRASIAYDAGRGVTLRGAFQSGSRGPTINELYRPFRVGNVVTQANEELRPETVRGFEGSAIWSIAPVTVRALVFWTNVDDAIVNVTLDAEGSPIVRQRQNAARIGANGAEVEVDLRLTDALRLTGATALIDSMFVEGPLDDLRVPQVPHVHTAIGIRGVWPRASFGTEWRFIGEQFDDDRNEFPLGESSTFDVRAGWRLRRSIELFAALENAFDAEQDVGRTPLRTIGLPRTFRVGVRMAR